VVGRALFTADLRPQFHEVNKCISPSLQLVGDHWRVAAGQDRQEVSAMARGIMPSLERAEGGFSMHRRSKDIASNRLTARSYSTTWELNSIFEC
jgi:hypothetical protein